MAIETQEDRLLAQLSYYKTGGSCKDLHFPTSTQAVAEIVKRCHDTSVPLLILGAGSNSLVSDDDYPGEVISMAKHQTIHVENERLLCGAGAINSDIAKYALNNKLTGAAWMYGLPGQLGGTVRMNARCYGGEISQIASSVTAVHPDGSIQTHTEKMFRGYKDTIFMDQPILITEVTLQLAWSEDPARDKAHMDHCYNDRNSKGQFLHPSCGCVFKNDYSVGVPSGLLLEHSGCKGLRVGKAAISDGHANFVYNTGGATSDEILELTFIMRQKVFDMFGVWLSYEMELLGAFSQDNLKKIHSQPNASGATAEQKQRLLQIKNEFEAKQRHP